MEIGLQNEEAMLWDHYIANLKLIHMWNINAKDELIWVKHITRWTYVPKLGCKALLEDGKIDEPI